MISRGQNLCFKVFMYFGGDTCKQVAEDWGAPVVEKLAARSNQIFAKTKMGESPVFFFQSTFTWRPKCSSFSRLIFLSYRQSLRPATFQVDGGASHIGGQKKGGGGHQKIVLISFVSFIIYILGCEWG